MIPRLARTCAPLLLAALLALPAGARAGSDDSSPSRRLVLSADLGGGGQLGTGSAYDPPGIFELEAGAAYEVVFGLAPQVTVVLGMAPGASFAIRPGLLWFVPGSPFYLRVAFDASTQAGPLSWRWLLLGGGAEIRVGGGLGFNVEFDGGVPLASGAGVPLLLRAGAMIRF